MQFKSYACSLVAGCLGIAFIASGALAADPTAPEIGRYQLLSGTANLGGKDTQALMMVDTVSGRVWIVDSNEQHGTYMKRLLLERLDKAPEGMLTRPLPLIVKPAQ